jgi:hypothetical protein
LKSDKLAIVALNVAQAIVDTYFLISRF